MLRLNVKPGDDSDENSKPQARFLMRADGSHRVVLNTPVKKEIKFGTPGGAPPTNGFIYFMGTFDGRDNLEMLQIKVKQILKPRQWTPKLTNDRSSDNNSLWSFTRRSSICRRKCRARIHDEVFVSGKLFWALQRAKPFRTLCTKCFGRSIGYKTLGCERQHEQQIPKIRIIPLR